MSIGLNMGESSDIYGNTNAALVRPPSGLGQTMNRGGGLMSANSQCGSMPNNRGIKRTNSDCYDDRAMGSQTLSTLDSCAGGVPDAVDDSYTQLQKKSPPANGKKTKGRVKIKMEYIDNKLRRYTTFSKRKTGIMKKVSDTRWRALLFTLNYIVYIMFNSIRFCIAVVQARVCGRFWAYIFSDKTVPMLKSVGYCLPKFLDVFFFWFCCCQN